MTRYATTADRDAIEAEAPWRDRDLPRTLYAMLERTCAAHGDRPALSFQLTAGATDRAETLDWTGFRDRVTQAANLFRRLGVDEETPVAYLLPNATETPVVLFGGATAGIVVPINPLLEPGAIAAILEETGARVLVTLAPFPQSDIAEKAARAVAEAPNVHTVLEVDLARYLPAPRRWAVPFLRPRRRARHHATTTGFTDALAGESAAALDFAESDADRVAACFHTGGTTGAPKLARHRFSGMIYNGWLGRRLLFGPEDTILCPLPLFHVLACHPVLMSAVASGAQVVMPTPSGFRGAGVVDNFWKLVERWRASFVIAVPTAISALTQRAVDADVSTLRMAFSGSAPLSVELYDRFRKATGVEIVEGYGLTEATCLVSCNPPEGEKKVGSVGIAFPYTDIRILPLESEGEECAPDEVGEICVANPGVTESSPFATAPAALGLEGEGVYLRTGDLGRLDADGYLWITGRAKDLIIRGGHNLDPAQIEDALLAHPAVAGAGAIGQPDAVSGELPCAYVELVEGAEVTADELRTHCRSRLAERAAVPKHVEILDSLPKTAVGKIYKPDLRKRALARVFDAALAEAGQPAEVADIREDRSRGLVAELAATGPVDAEAVRRTLGEFTYPWEWREG